MLLIFIILSILLIGSQIYFEKVIYKKVSLKRKQKIFELLKNSYKGLKENNLGSFECIIDNKSVLFEFTTSVYRFNISNHLTVYFEIMDIEDDIKKLCKIHFNCSNIDNRDWVKMQVELLLSNSLNSLVKHSEKTVRSVISETDFYISQKRAERDKRIATY